MMTENSWIPVALAEPEEDAAVDMRFADGEVITGKYCSGRFSDKNRLVWLSGVKEWRPASDKRKDQE